MNIETFGIFFPKKSGKVFLMQAGNNSFSCRDIYILEVEIYDWCIINSDDHKFLSVYWQLRYANTFELEPTMKPKSHI